MRIRRNLDDALRAIRNHYRTYMPPVWADALCINQEDIPERNREVKRMREIYKTAVITIAWLGKPHVWEFSGVRSDKINWDTIDLPLIREGSNEPVLPDGPILTKEEVLAIIVLLSRPYWSRVWIFQEIILSNDRLCIFWGTKLARYRDLKAAVELLRAHISSLWSVYKRLFIPYEPGGSHSIPEGAFNTPFGLQSIGEFADQIQKPLSSSPDQELLVARDVEQPGQGQDSIDDARTDLELRIDLDLVELRRLVVQFVQLDLAVYSRLEKDRFRIYIQQAREAQATDQKDLVYAMLGLHTNDISDGITPNYLGSYTAKQVFIDFAVALVNSRGLNVLCDLTNEIVGWREGWPSWIIDFTEERAALTKLHPVGRGGHPVERLKQCYAGGPGFTFIQFLAGGFGMRCQAAIVNRLTRPHLRSRYLNQAAIQEALRRIFSWQSTQDETPVPSIFDMLWGMDKLHPEWSDAFTPGTIFWRVHAPLKIDGTDLADFFPKQVDTSTWDENFIMETMQLITHQKLVLTEEGSLGLVVTEATAGDYVALFQGCSFPIALRPYRDGFKWIGPCYIDGIMHGEAIESGLDWREVTIW